VGEATTGIRKIAESVYVSVERPPKSGSSAIVGSDASIFPAIRNSDEGPTVIFDRIGPPGGWVML
jgi:hypothetical protein